MRCIRDQHHHCVQPSQCSAPPPPTPPLRHQIRAHHQRHLLTAPYFCHQPPRNHTAALRITSPTAPLHPALPSPSPHHQILFPRPSPPPAAHFQHLITPPAAVVPARTTLCQIVPPPCPKSPQGSNPNNTTTQTSPTPHFITKIRSIDTPFHHRTDASPSPLTVQPPRTKHVPHHCDTKQQPHFTPLQHPNTILCQHQLLLLLLPPARSHHHHLHSHLCHHHHLLHLHRHIHHQHQQPPSSLLFPLSNTRLGERRSPQATTTMRLSDYASASLGRASHISVVFFFPFFFSLLMRWGQCKD